MDTIKGSVETLIYVQPENGFTVARLKEAGKKECTVIVGHLPSLQPGEFVSCSGSWKMHPSHGRQFEVSDYVIEMPSDLAGVQKYLESGLVKGIGSVFAKKIIDRFGADTLLVIEQAPDRLYEIKGLGEKKIDALKHCWTEQKSIRDIMIFLRSHGVSPAYAQKIYKAYGANSIEKVRENPYDLAKNIFGIGFKLADLVAQKLGFALHSPGRLAAGIQHVFWELSTEGHTCYPEQEFLPLAQKTLDVDLSLLETQLQRLVQNKTLVRKTEFVKNPALLAASASEQEQCPADASENACTANPNGSDDNVEEQEKVFLWLSPFFSYEQGIAHDIQRLKTRHQAIRSINAQKAVEWVEEKVGIRFAQQQREAVTQALIDKVHIITGGPGTGKSTITKAILTITEKLTDKILLAAPTGRAAKRLTQITHKKAFTIHALLEMDFRSRGCKRCRENPLDCHLLIIDEASMIDTPLLFYLLRAIPDHARLLLVGDIDQLPSVGPGTVLRDLIASATISITRLTEIFRQAKDSKIITNAHQINQGVFPSIHTSPDSDFHYIEAENPEAILQVVSQLVAKEIPEKWSFNPIDDIQVLSPMKKGVIGVEWLNETLQHLLNPSTQPLLRAGRRFHLADKVMQIQNNYDKKIYNGDIGRISYIDLAEQTLSVLFDDRSIEYQFGELDQLILAYATSVHKFQGSECPCIVMPIHTTHFKLLQRNLLYTAVTRGKKQVYLVGTKKALAIAVHNNEIQKRYTGLESALRNTASSIPIYPQNEQLEFLSFL